MRIGIVELYCGGSGKKGFYNSQEIGLSRAMKKLGHEMFVFYPDVTSKDVTEELVECGVTVLRVPAKHIGVHGCYDWNIFLKYGLEVVQINGDNQLWVPECVKFCEDNDIKIYYYLGTLESDSSNIIKKYILQMLAYRNLKCYARHKCFAKTEAVRERLEQLGVKEVEVAPVGLDTAIIPSITENKVMLRERLSIPVDATAILFVGRLEPYKRPEEAVELMHMMQEQKNIVLIMIGTGSLDERIANLIKQYSLEERIIRIKEIPNKKIHEYYAACDIFVNFNDHEIFGMSILEAMYQGCTVIARHAPGPDSIIKDNLVGYLVYDIVKMKDIILSLGYMDKQTVRDYILDNFTWDNMANIINNMIASKDFSRSLEKRF